MNTAVLRHEMRRRRLLVTPEGIGLNLTVASRGGRFGALLIDLGIIIVLTVVTTLLLIWMFGGIANLDERMKQNDAASQAMQFIEILWMAAQFLFWNGYFMFFELGPRGATPGKRLLGIRVASRDGGRLTAEMVLARNLLRDIELFLPLSFLILGTSGEMGGAGLAATAWFLLFALFPFFNRDALRAGDLIAGTWVVESPRSKLLEAMSLGNSARGGLSTATGTSYRFGEKELAAYGEYELQTLERVLREGRHEAMAAVQDAICRKIGWDPGAGDEHAFLEAYYTQLRARLEGGMRLGVRKADKWEKSVRFHFTEAELSVYGEPQLRKLERVLQENQRDQFVTVHAAICAKLGRAAVEGEERAFLDAYYAQARARLKGGMRLGVRKAD